MANADITKLLTEEFPRDALQTREQYDPETKRKKALTYVDAATVFRRLIRATDNSFDVAVVNQEIRPFGSTKSGNERLLLVATVRITIPGMGSREHVGVQVVNAASGGEDLWKGAVSDGIKKAATLFGVGLELYGPDYEAEEPTGTTTDAFAALGEKLVDAALSSEQFAAQKSNGLRERVRQGRAVADDAPPQPAPAQPPAAPGGGLRAKLAAAASQAVAVAERPADPVTEAIPGDDAEGYAFVVPTAGVKAASDAQKGLILGLWKEMGYETDDGHTDRASLQYFLDLAQGPDFDGLKMNQASAVIGYLKDEVARRALQGDEDLDHVPF